ncbi:hypothetical protein AB4Z54_65475 [Streptomyces sp. MCAF7]
MSCPNSSSQGTLWDIAGKAPGVPAAVKMNASGRMTRLATVRDIDAVVGRARPTAPGLGIEVDERAVRAADGRAPGWRGPIWAHPDGSFAEW